MIMPIPIVKFFDSLPLFWRLATVRLLIYLYVVGHNAWMASIEGFDSLSDMTPLQIEKMHANVLLAIATTIIAFLDNGMSIVKQHGTLSADDVRTILSETRTVSQTTTQETK